ncbi:hypothetical protein ES702_02592 [subsurface metagenome]
MPLIVSEYPELIRELTHGTGCTQNFSFTESYLHIVFINKELLYQPK